MNKVENGIYDFYFNGDEGKELVGYFEVKDNNIYYHDRKSELNLEDNFPEGKINHMTSNNIYKYLHGHKPHVELIKRK